MFGEWTKEVTEGIEIIKPAIQLSLISQEKLSNVQIEQKSDGTVVSISDFACQSLIMSGLQKSFPTDHVLGEENFSSGNENFIRMVKSLLPPDFDPVDACKDAITKITPDIHRVWVIDPIDGTYGFVEQGNYAVAMALLVDKQVRVSVVGWPRHKPEYTGIPVDGPVIFVAAFGHGAYAVDMQNNFYPVKKLQNPRNRIIYSASAKSDEISVHKSIAEQLGITEELDMVSMTKGFVVGLGSATLYLRIRCTNDEHVWDIAPFELFVRESGGFATTWDGKAIEYTEDGDTFNSKNGLVFTNVDEEFHMKVLSLYRKQKNLE